MRQTIRLLLHHGHSEHSIHCGLPREYSALDFCREVVNRRHETSIGFFIGLELDGVMRRASTHDRHIMVHDTSSRDLKYAHWNGCQF